MMIIETSLVCNSICASCSNVYTRPSHNMQHHSGQSMLRPTCHTPQPLDAILICFESRKAADELHAQIIKQPCFLQGANCWVCMPGCRAHV